MYEAVSESLDLLFAGDQVSPGYEESCWSFDSIHGEGEGGNDGIIRVIGRDGQFH